MQRAGNFSLILLLSCLLFGCGQEKVEDTIKPALRLTFVDADAGSVTLKVETVNATACHILCLKADENAPDAADIISKGEAVELDKAKKAQSVQVNYKGLEDKVSYVAYGVASSSTGKTGTIASLTFSTTKGAQTLYSWEQNRTELPSYSNMALCYGGSKHRSPYKWDKDRFDSHVTYKDANGKERWLFDAFLAIEFADTGNNMEYAGGYGRNAADKDSWTRLLDYWFESGYGFDALNKSVGEAIKRIGAPATRRKVVMTMPDAILHKNFKDANSTTQYWGWLGSKMPDFNIAEERLSALQWFIDETRLRWSRAGYDNLEFIGFYCVSEDLAVPGYGWSQDLKRWEDVYPAITKYIHSCNETMNWIPYRKAGGYQLWADFGFDYAMMQPNYFWHSEYDMNEYQALVKAYKMSMEFEFDDAVLESSEGYEAYRVRFNKYISMCKDMGLYRTRELSYYMGGNTLYLLKHSSSAKDQEFYQMVCEFIKDSNH